MVYILKYNNYSLEIQTCFQNSLRISLMLIVLAIFGITWLVAFFFSSNTQISEIGYKEYWGIPLKTRCLAPHWLSSGFVFCIVCSSPPQSKEDLLLNKHFSGFGVDKNNQAYDEVGWWWVLGQPEPQNKTVSKNILKKKIVHVYFGSALYGPLV